MKNRNILNIRKYKDLFYFKMLDWIYKNREGGMYPNANKDYLQGKRDAYYNVICLLLADIIENEYKEEQK